MAQEIVGIKIQVGGQEKVLSSMGEIRKELKAAQFDVLKFSEAFGASSKEAIEAAKRVAQLKDAIGDAKDLVGAFNPDAKFKALSGSIQGVAGGFAALQGALALVGVEGDNVQKTLLKVQSALALSEGLNSVMGSIDAFKNLGAVIKNTVVNAFSTLRGAIIATGVGALAIGLGLVAANFEKVRDTVFKLVPGLESLTKVVGGLVQQFTDFVGITNEADRNLEALEKRNKRANEDIEARIKILTAQGGKEKEIYEQSKQLIKNDLQVLEERLTARKKLTDEEYKKIRDLKNDLAVLDAKEQKRLADDAKEAKKKADEKAKQDREKIAKDAAERAAAEKEAATKLAELRGEIEVLGIKDQYEARRKEIENQLQAEIKQVQSNEKIKSETKKALVAALEKKAQAEIVAVVNEEIKAGQESALELQKKFQEDQRAIQAGGIQARIEQLDRENQMIEMDFEQDLERLAEKRDLLAEQEAIELQNAELTEFQKFEIRKKYADQRNEVTKQEVEIEKAAAQAKAEINQRYLDLAGQFGAVLQQIAGKNKALAIAGVVVEQAASIGRIIANTGIANAKAVAASPLTLGQPFVAINSISAGLSIASSVAAGLKAVQQINQAQPGGGSGASPVSASAAPISPAAPIQNTVTQLDSQSVNQIGNANNRAYVLETDVTNSQERIKRINRAARLT